MERRYREVADELLQDIVTGELRQGAWLPGVEALSARFGVGRGVIRESVRALEERRLVSVRSGRGQCVLAVDRWDVLDPDVLDVMVRSRRDSALVLEALDALRLAEPHAGAVAARRAREGDFSVLAATVHRMRLAAGRRGADASAHPFIESYVAFHRALMLIAGNRPLARMIEPLIEVLARMLDEQAPERDAAVVRHHERILAALRARDAPATRGALDAHAQQLGRWLTATRTSRTR